MPAFFLCMHVPLFLVVTVVVVNSSVAYLLSLDPMLLSSVISQNNLEGAVTISEDFASFPVREIIFGDIMISFEHFFPKENRTKPLFSIAYHTGFLSLPYTRFGAKDLEVYPEARDMVIIDKNFTVDLFVSAMPELTGMACGLFVSLEVLRIEKCSSLIPFGLLPSAPHRTSLTLLPLLWVL